MLREDLPASEPIRQGATPAEITALFRRFDLDADGTITRKEITDVLKMLDPVLWGDSNLSLLLNEMYPDSRPAIDYSEFLTWVMAGSSSAKAVLDQRALATHAPSVGASAAADEGGARRRRPARSGSSRERKRSPVTERSPGRSRPARTSSPAHQNSSSREASTQSRQATPPHASQYGSRVAKRACLTCREKLPGDGAEGWMKLRLGAASAGDCYVSRSELTDQLEGASEWQLLEAVPTLPSEQAFDVSVGRPLKDMLPPNQFAREEGWVTCSWLERPAVRKGASSDSPSAAKAEGEVAGVAAEGDASGGAGSAEAPASEMDTGEAAAEAVPDEEDDEDKSSELQVKVVVQMQELNEKGLLRLFSQTSLAPEVCQVWWRVGPRTSEGFLPDELLDVVIQSLDIDEGITAAPEAVLHRDPPSFLKPHQRKSIQWMSAREHSAEPFIADWHAVCPLHWQFSTSLSKAPVRWEAGGATPSEREAPKKEGPSRVNLGDGPISLQLDYRMENVYEIHGGVLADPVGSGKTATCLSHVACAHGAAMPAGGTWQRQYLLSLDATLVLCPENVHHQWLAEIHKWPELEEVIDPVPIHNVESLVKAGIRSSTKRKARVVVAPYSIFNDEAYKRKLLSPISSTPEDWKKKSSTLQFSARSGEPCKGVALESYRWRRVILDEFHELAGTSDELKAARKVLRFLQSEMRWGVSGTPEELLRSTGTARRAAKIFHCELNARRSAQRFCEQFYRSSRVDLDVAVQHRVIPVTHSAQETAIYTQYVRDLSLTLGSRPWRDDEVSKLSQLLQLCSHFSAEEAPVAMRTAENTTEAAVALHLHKGRAVTKALLEVESQTKYWEDSCMEFEDLRLPALRGPRRGRPHFNPACATCSRARSLCDECRQAAVQKTRETLECAHRKANEALKSLNFFDAVWQLALRSTEEAHCVICLDEYQIQDGGLLHCAHMFCFNCISFALKAGRRACPLCRAPMNESKVVPVRQLRTELLKKKKEEEEEEHPMEAAIDYGKTCSKYGSKLQAIVWALAEVKKEDVEAKVIIFSQWQNLETKIADALSEFHILHLRLSTCADIFQRRRVLESFQDPANREARVLLLSLDGHASGTNLTCASHVFLVHPMLAAMAEQQAAYERQAIGRAARLGQRKTVTVWRFLTRGTVEEEVARSM